MNDDHVIERIEMLDEKFSNRFDNLDESIEENRERIKELESFRNGQKAVQEYEESEEVKSFKSWHLYLVLAGIIVSNIVAVLGWFA